MAKDKKVPVSLRALIQRINRKLKPDLQQLKATRGERWRLEQGDYFVIDHARRWVVENHVDVESYGRELGVLQPWERVVDDTP